MAGSQMTKSKWTNYISGYARKPSAINALFMSERYEWRRKMKECKVVAFSIVKQTLR